MGKLGVLMRYREDSEMQLRRLNAAMFVGPAFIHEVPESSRFSSTNLDARNHFGVNFGIEAEMPFSNQMFALHAALEDYVIFWDETAMQEKLNSRILNTFGSEAAAEVDADHSNMVVLRLGLSFRFR
jgi:hypothetical protein